MRGVIRDFTASPFHSGKVPAKRSSSDIAPFETRRVTARPARVFVMLRIGPLAKRFDSAIRDRPSQSAQPLPPYPAAMPGSILGGSRWGVDPQPTIEPASPAVESFSQSRRVHMP